MKRSVCIIGPGSHFSFLIRQGLIHEVVKHYGRCLYIVVGNKYSHPNSSVFMGIEQKELRFPKGLKVLTPTNLVSLIKIILKYRPIIVSDFGLKPRIWYIYIVARLLSCPIVYNSSIPRAPFGLLWNINKTESRLRKKKIETYFLWSLRMMGLISVDILFTASEIERKKHVNSQWINHVVPVNALQTDERPEGRSVSEKYVVYLDAAEPNHGDNKGRGWEEVDPRQHYMNLNKLLELVSSVIGKEYVICLHPKRPDMELYKDKMSGRVTIGKTPHYVRQAALVLFSTTSAFNAGVMYDKPLIQINDSTLNPFWKDLNRQYTEIFGCPSIDCSSLCTTDAILAAYKSALVHRTGNAYRNYAKNYIFLSGNQEMSSSTQIVEHLVEFYG